MCERGGWGAEKALPRKDGFRSLFAHRLTSATELCARLQPQGEEVQSGNSLAGRKSRTANGLIKGQMK